MIWFLLTVSLQLRYLSVGAVMRAGRLELGSLLVLQVCEGLAVGPTFPVRATPAGYLMPVSCSRGQGVAKI